MDSVQRDEVAACMAPTGQDVYSLALAEQGRSGPLLVEREWGGLHPTSLAWWLRHPLASVPFEFAALARVGAGPVLDIGCATGRHLEWLHAAGIEAEGIDLNPHAVRLAQAAGCTATCADIWHYAPRRRFAWLLALGNNLGIAGRLSALPGFLARLSDLLLPDGKVLLSSMAPDGTADGLGTAADAPYPGEIQLRHHYAGRVGAWFDWLYVDPLTLAGFAGPAGFATEIVESDGTAFLALLTKEGARHAV